MDPLLLVLIVMIVFLAFQFFFNGRRKKQQDEKRKEQLVPGAQVMTNGGLFGKVIAVMDQEKKVIVEIAPGVDVTFHSQAIVNFESPDSRGKETAEKPVVGKQDSIEDTDEARAADEESQEHPRKE